MLYKLQMAQMTQPIVFLEANHPKQLRAIFCMLMWFIKDSAQREKNGDKWFIHSPQNVESDIKTRNAIVRWFKLREIFNAPALMMIFLHSGDLFPGNF